LHVEQARARGLSAEPGDARALNHPDETFDVVLLMGPLYHLTSQAERAQALAEARRVLRPGGQVIATAIARYAALLDLLIRLDRLHEPSIFDCVEEAVRTGVFRGHEHTGLFTTAYFHLPDELSAELAQAGFASCEMLNIEGPGFLVRDLDSRWADPARREVMLRTARLLESRPEMLAAASHLMAVAQRPSMHSPGDRR
jgi:SAM-dependent methyltransferase